MRKRASLIILSLLIFFASSVFANGLSLNSIGTRAIGMGGAYIGLANDYSAIYWNPAGLTRVQGPQVSIFVSDIMPTGTYKFDTYGINAEMKSNHYISPNIMGYLPLFCGEKLFVGLGAFVPAGLGAEWEGSDLAAFSGPAGTAYEWMSKIGVFNISPGVSYKVSDKISVGAAMNVFYGMMDMKRPVDSNEDHLMDAQYEESGSGLGYGLSLGLLVKPIDMLSVGLSFKTKTTVKFEGTASNTAFQASNAADTDYERDLAWPMWIGGGIAFCPTKKLTITADVQYSKWSETEEKIVTDYKNNVWAGAMSEEDRTMVLNWEDATQIRFGSQYKLTEALAVRAGYYSDPAPAPDETVNIIFPSISYNAITAGASYCLGKVSLDLGLEYLMGSDREIAQSALGNMPGTHGMSIVVASFGLTYSFK
ncbi:outer membrane protein transport protein [candidate division KSB1 bacterium]|nr:outer membrane protein transport protein [candidate division KSB1 bacterium]MBL7095150.1 outer membrane protein transport protein [candidate division KSB1 bacterium]